MHILLDICWSPNTIVFVLSVFIISPYLIASLWQTDGRTELRWLRRTESSSCFRAYKLNRMWVVALLQFSCTCIHAFNLCMQALAGEVGMSNELDNVARSLYNGHIPSIWRRLAPATLKTLGNWMIHFQQRYDQYDHWVGRRATFSLY